MLSGNEAYFLFYWIYSCESQHACQVLLVSLEKGFFSLLCVFCNQAKQKLGFL